MTESIGSRKAQMSTARRLWFIIGAGLVAASTFVFWLKPRADSVMTVAVTITTDDTSPVEVYSTRVPIPGSRRNESVKEVSIDLSRWEGQLVQVDIRGKLVSSDASATPLGHLGCSAELSRTEGTEPIEFVGWQNEPPSKVHVGELGPQTMVAREIGGRTFVYASEGSLWHVLRVPEAAELRLSLLPVPAEEVNGDPKLFVPSLRSVGAGPSPTRSAEAERPPDVFIYLIDALRPDHLGCYGYDRGTSPNIDAFAADAVLFENAYAPAPWTHPSVPSLLTGLYPQVHGSSSHKDKLDSWPVLLSEVLRDAGYRTFHVSTNPHTSEQSGLLQGVDESVYAGMESASWVNSHAARLLAREDADQPVYMYLHTVEPHSPYSPVAESCRLFDRGFLSVSDGSVESMKAIGSCYPWVSRRDLEHLVDLYDGEILDSDRGFREFLNTLERAGRLENALIVLLSDHGEAFGEHDAMEHGRTLNAEMMRSVLILRLPGNRSGGKKVERRASLIDVLPTVLSVVGESPRLPYRLPGVDLTRAIDSFLPGKTARDVYGELSWGETDRLDMVSVIDADGYKRVIDLSSPRGKLTTNKAVGLWDTNVDPQEQVDLTGSLPVRASYHEQLLARWLAEQSTWRGEASSGIAAPSLEMTDDLRDDLRALGYLE